VWQSRQVGSLLCPWFLTSWWAFTEQSGFWSQPASPPMGSLLSSMAGPRRLKRESRKRLPGSVQNFRIQSDHLPRTDDSAEASWRTTATLLVLLCKVFSDLSFFFSFFLKRISDLSLISLFSAPSFFRAVTVPSWHNTIWPHFYHLRNARILDRSKWTHSSSVQ
jgi:hypothetical protein